MNESARSTGTIVKWFDSKGYGFVAKDGEKSRQLFIHINAFGSSTIRPCVNLRISFIMDSDAQGRQRAESAKLINGFNKGIRPTNTCYALSTHLTSVI